MSIEVDESKTYCVKLSCLACGSKIFESVNHSAGVDQCKKCGKFNRYNTESGFQKLADDLSLSPEELASDEKKLDELLEDLPQVSDAQMVRILEARMVKVQRELELLEDAIHAVKQLPPDSNS